MWQILSQCSKLSKEFLQCCMATSARYVGFLRVGEGNVFIKPICANILILNLIRFQGCSQTYFLEYLVVYLILKRIDLSTITRQRKQVQYR
jgi:hypothetical protein